MPFRPMTGTKRSVVLRRGVFATPPLPICASTGLTTKPAKSATKTNIFDFIISLSLYLTKTLYTEKMILQKKKAATCRFRKRSEIHALSLVIFGNNPIFTLSRLSPRPYCVGHGHHKKNHPYKQYSPFHQGS